MMVCFGGKLNPIENTCGIGIMANTQALFLQLIGHITKIEIFVLVLVLSP